MDIQQGDSRGAAGKGVTYEQLTGDLSQVNYSSYRASHLEFSGLVDAFRCVTLIPVLCKPVWNRFVETAYNTRIISGQKYGSKWIPPAYQSIDPLKDADADLKRIRSGMLTLPEAIAQQGYDVEQQLNEIEATNKVLDVKGIILGCDPRRVNDKGAARPNPEKAVAN